MLCGVRTMPIEGMHALQSQSRLACRTSSVQSNKVLIDASLTAVSRSDVEERLLRMLCSLNCHSASENSSMSSGTSLQQARRSRVDCDLRPTQQAVITDLIGML